MSLNEFLYNLGFNRKEFRAKLAIGLTVNFINHKSDADARVEEMSGVASLYNPEFFKVYLRIRVFVIFIF